MNLLVRTPPGHGPERQHAVALVLTDFLGLPFEQVEDGALEETTIEVGGDRRQLSVAEGLFACSPGQLLTASALPTEPCPVHPCDRLPPGARVLESSLPALWSTGPPWEIHDGRARLGIDVFGGAFYLTTRLEEAVSPDRDRHGRFPLRASLLKRAGLLHRPLANEYAEVLWAALRQLWPQLERPPRRFRVVSTHDVDSPFALLNCGVGGLARAAAAAGRRAGVRGAVRTMGRWREVQSRGVEADPTNNFDAVMDADEAAGAESAFYFIPDPDPVGRIRRQVYRLDDPAIQDLLVRVKAREHEIGFHPSYGAHADRSRLAGELARLQAGLAALGIEQAPMGGRHHFLRWDARSSPRDWADLGLRYDSSVGFAEEPGYRSGACQPFQQFDLEQHRSLGLLERPLLLMDVSVTGSQYLGLEAGSTAALELIHKLKASCRRFDGEFMVLWHNDVLADPGQWELYREAIAGN